MGEEEEEEKRRMKVLRDTGECHPTILQASYTAPGKDVPNIYMAPPTPNPALTPQGCN